MRIRLTRDPPVNPNHGLVVGLELETHFPPEPKDSDATLGTVWVKSLKTGILVKLFRYEYEVINGGPNRTTEQSMGPATEIQSSGDAASAT